MFSPGKSAEDRLGIRDRRSPIKGTADEQRPDVRGDGGPELRAEIGERHRRADLGKRVIDGVARHAGFEVGPDCSVPRLGGARRAVGRDAHEVVTAVLPVGARKPCNCRVVIERKRVKRGDEARSRRGRPHLRGREELKIERADRHLHAFDRYGSRGVAKLIDEGGDFVDEIARRFIPAREPACEVGETGVDNRGALERMVGTLHSVEHQRADAIGELPEVGERQMSAVAGGPEGQTRGSQASPQDFEVADALTRVVGGYVDAVRLMFADAATQALAVRLQARGWLERTVERIAPGFGTGKPRVAPGHRAALFEQDDIGHNDRVQAAIGGLSMKSLFGSTGSNITCFGPLIRLVRSWKPWSRNRGTRQPRPGSFVN